MDKSVPRKSSHKQYAKRLISYTTAASLGALGGEYDANAAVVFLDIPDITLSSTPVSPFSEFEAHEQLFDLNNDGIDDILFQARYRALNNKNIDDTAGAGDISARRFGGSTIMVPVAQPYYIGAFALGTPIGPTTPIALHAAPNYQLFLSLAYRYPSAAYPYYSYNGGQFGSGYVGVRFNIGGSPHFGWVEVETNPEGEMVASVTIKSYAYESTPNTAILAGDTGGGSGGIDGDFDGDGDVDGRDFLVWQRGGTTPALDPGLLAQWQGNYGHGTLAAVSTTVPEPCSLALLAGGAGALAFTRRKRA